MDEKEFRKMIDKDQTIRNMIYNIDHNQTIISTLCQRVMAIEDNIVISMVCCEHSMIKYSHDRKGNQFYTTYICVGCGAKEQVHDYTLGGLK